MEHLVATGDVRPAQGSRPAASKIYRNKASIEGDQRPFKGTTLHETFQDSVSTYSNQPCFGYRLIDKETGKAGDYQWITYAEANEKVKAVASGLAGLGVSAGQKVGVYGANCLEWQSAMQVILTTQEAHRCNIQQHSIFIPTTTWYPHYLTGRALVAQGSNNSSQSLVTCKKRCIAQTTSSIWLTTYPHGIP